MPWSSKKKRHQSNASADGAEAAGAARTQGLDPQLKAFLIGIKDEINKFSSESIDRLSSRLVANAKEIIELRREVVAKEVNLDRKIKNKIHEAISKTKANVTLVSKSVNSRRELAYDFCRRSVKMWPVEGEDLSDSAKVFMKNKLGIPDARISMLGKIETSFPPGRAARERKEILVTFESKEGRDFVKSSGANLAAHRDSGMSIHVPGHLVDNLLLLNSIGYKIKSKHSGVKRTVKFDDINQNIYLDIYVGGNWKRITPEEARTALKDLLDSVDSRSLSAADLSSLVQGEQLPGLRQL